MWCSEFFRRTEPRHTRLPARPAPGGRLPAFGAPPVPGAGDTDAQPTAAPLAVHSFAMPTVIITDMSLPALIMPVGGWPALRPRAHVETARSPASTVQAAVLANGCCPDSGWRLAPTKST